MDLTREEALRLHREMWSDMQNDLGNDPGIADREAYKDDWCDEHGFEDVDNSCFLCKYSHGKKTGVLLLLSCQMAHMERNLLFGLLGRWH